MLGHFLKNLILAMLALSLIALAVNYVGDYLVVYQKERLRIKNPLRFDPRSPEGKRYRSE